MAKEWDSEFRTWRQFALLSSFSPAAVSGGKQGQDDGEDDGKVGRDRRTLLHDHLHFLPGLWLLVASEPAGLNCRRVCAAPLLYT